MNAPLTFQKVSNEFASKLKTSYTDHLFGKFRVKNPVSTINLSHLKRIRNKNNEISMLVGTQDTCVGLEHMENSFEIEVPSRMIY